MELKNSYSSIRNKGNKKSIFITNKVRSSNNSIYIPKQSNNNNLSLLSNIITKRISKYEEMKNNKLYTALQDIENKYNMLLKTYNKTYIFNILFGYINKYYKQYYNILLNAMYKNTNEKYFLHNLQNTFVVYINLNNYINNRNNRLEIILIILEKLLNILTKHIKVSNNKKIKNYKLQLNNKHSNIIKLLLKDKVNSDRDRIRKINIFNNNISDALRLLKNNNSLIMR